MLVLHLPFLSLMLLAPTRIYPLSLHDALPISPARGGVEAASPPARGAPWRGRRGHCRRATSLSGQRAPRSEEHTSELQSHSDLVCRLLLEKKKAFKEMCLLPIKKL